MKRTQLRWIALLALPLGALACAKSAPEGTTKSGETATADKAEAFGRLTVEEVQAKMADAKAGKLALFIFDNNGKERFEKGHVPGAKWVKGDEVNASVLPADKQATLVFYCGNEQCSACHNGASGALALGYKNVYIMPAGIAGWEKAQKPVERV